MPEYDFYCHACNKPFAKMLTPAEYYEEGVVTCPHCGSEEVEQRWFYAAEARHNA